MMLDGCSTCETKRSGIGNVMLEQNLYALTLSEANVKGKGECIFEVWLEERLV